MDSLNRRAFARLVLTLAGSAPCWSACAQVTGGSARLIVGYPAGGTLDTTARHLSESWRRQGRQFIVDNRAGAAGRIANSQLKREPPDGSVLLCTHTSALTIYPHVYSKLMYDAASDFVPISTIVSATCAMAIGRAVPSSVRSLQDYVTWARRHPDQAVYASPAAGSMAHFLGFRFAEAAGLKLQHVAYRGSAPAMQDLIGGHVPTYIGFVADFLPYLEQGKIRVLGVASEQRSRFVRSVPTFAEQGFHTVKGTETYGVFAPPRTPDAVVATAFQAVVAASRDDALRAAMEQVGLEPQTLPPAEYAKLIQQERQAWAPVVRASGFRFDD